MASGSRKVIIAALVGNTLVALTKFAAAAVTGSSAMISEGIHSVVDTGNQVLLLYGIHRSKKPPDSVNPFGHGKEIYFWSFVVAILIFALGAGISIYEGIIHMLHPGPIENPSVNYVVLILAMIFEGVALYMAVTQFSKAKGKRGYIEAVRKGKDPSLFVVLFEDAAAMMGLLVAFIGVLGTHLTEIPYFDGGASIIIGLILGSTAIWLAYETKGLLIGESAGEKTIEGIREIAASFDVVDHVNEILTMHMGPEYILANLSVDFSDGVSSTEMERIIASMDKRIKETFPLVRRIFIEAEARRTPQQVPPGEESTGEEL